MSQINIQELIASTRNVVKVACAKQAEREVAVAISEGFDDWSNHVELLLSDVPADILLECKEGGEIFTRPKSIALKIQEAVKEMLDVQHLKQQDWEQYASITGMDLWSVVNTESKPMRAIVNGLPVTTPLRKAALDKRASVRNDITTIKAELAITIGKMKTMTEKERESVIPCIEALRSALVELREIESDLDLRVSELFETEKALVAEHTRGNKDAEIHKLLIKAVKDGRTALEEFKKYENMYGIEDVVNLNDIAKAKKLFRVQS